MRLVIWVSFLIVVCLWVHISVGWYHQQIEC
nr:unnamed protein product [Callosobruchus chinensis]